MFLDTSLKRSITRSILTFVLISSSSTTPLAHTKNNAHTTNNTSSIADFELTFDVEARPHQEPAAIQAVAELQEQHEPLANHLEKTEPKNREQTLALIKPDGVRGLKTGSIISVIELNKFTIRAIKKLQLTKAQAQEFYAEHTGKPFFDELIAYMTSGPLLALILEKENALRDWRKLMGSTNPTEADPGTIRKMFGTSKTFNVVHGSDSAESAQRETKILFQDS